MNRLPVAESRLSNPPPPRTPFTDSRPDVGGTAGVQQSEMLGRRLDAAHTTVEIDGMTVHTMVCDGRSPPPSRRCRRRRVGWTAGGVYRVEAPVS